MTKDEKPIGIIEALSTAYAVITERFWLLLIPFGLDLVLWAGPYISARPVFQRAADAVALPPELASQQPELATQADTIRDLLASTGQGFNVLSLLVARLIGVPGLLADFPELITRDGPTLTLQSPTALIVTSITVGIAGLFIACIWFGLLARSAREVDPAQSLPPAAAGLLVRKAVKNVLRICGLIIGFLLIAAAVTMPMSVILTFASLVSPQVGGALSGILSLVLLWAILWLGIHLYFVVEAIILQDVGPWPAVRNSFRVVRGNFWSVLLLIVLVFVIGRGFGFIWTEIARNPVGLVLAVAGNTYIGTGLAMAVLLYYNDRYHFMIQAEQETT